MLVQHMSLYPPETIFFLNVWCFGWEDVVKEVARHFDSLVHVDRYKRSIYSAVRTDSFLVKCTTTDPTATRFHACDRKHRCESCKGAVVNVHMVEMKDAQVDLQNANFLEAIGQAALGEADWPRSIVSHVNQNQS